MLKNCLHIAKGPFYPSFNCVLLPTGSSSALVCSLQIMPLKCSKWNWIFKHHLFFSFSCVDPDATSPVEIRSNSPGLFKGKLKWGSCGVIQRLQELLRYKLVGCVTLGKLLDLSEPVCSCIKCTNTNLYFTGTL